MWSGSVEIAGHTAAAADPARRELLLCPGHELTFTCDDDVPLVIYLIHPMILDPATASWRTP